MVVGMRGLEDIQVHIGNTNLDIYIIEEGDEAGSLGPLWTIMQTKSFNVSVEWRLLQAETRMSNTSFRTIDLDYL